MKRTSIETIEEKPNHMEGKLKWVTKGCWPERRAGRVRRVPGRGGGPTTLLVAPFPPPAGCGRAHAPSPSLGVQFAPGPSEPRTLFSLSLARFGCTRPPPPLSPPLLWIAGAGGPSAAPRVPPGRFPRRQGALRAVRHGGHGSLPLGGDVPGAAHHPRRVRARHRHLPGGARAAPVQRREFQVCASVCLFLFACLLARSLVCWF